MNPKNGDWSPESYRAAVARGDLGTLIAQASSCVALIGVDAAALLSIVGAVDRVAISSWVETAVIERRAASLTIRIGRKYLTQQLPTIEDFAYILSHELGHLALHVVELCLPVWPGEADEDRYSSGIRNIAADMQVCVLLHSLWRYTPDLCYRQDGKGFLSALLSTPEVLLGTRWKVGDPLLLSAVAEALDRRAVEEGAELTSRSTERAAQLYCEVWKERLSLAQIQDELGLLLEPFARQVEDFSAAIVRGGHPGCEIGDDPRLRRHLREKCPPSFRNRIGGIVRRNILKGGEGGDLEEHEISGLQREEVVTRIATLLSRYFKPGRKKMGIGVQEDGTSQTPLLLRKREAFWLAAGYHPPLYPDVQPTVTTRKEKLLAYVDLSASTEPLWRSLIEALRRVFAHREIQAWGFSTCVEPLTINHGPLRSISTTGGTDFNCVVRHALQHAPAISGDIFILTDGFARLDPGMAEKAARQNLSFQLILVDPCLPSKPPEAMLRKMFRGCLGTPGITSISGLSIA